MTIITTNNIIKMETVIAITVILFPDTVGIVVVPVEVVVAVISVVVVAVGK